MAIGFANLGVSSGTSTTNPDIRQGNDAASYSGTSWTPPTTGVIACFVANRIANPGNIPTLTGNGITWYNIQTVSVDPGAAHRITLFLANATGSVAGTNAIDFAGEVQISCEASFFHITGSVDLTQGVTGSVVQTANGNGTATSGTVTLAAAGNSNNRPIACFSHQANEYTNPNPNWTEIDDMSGAGPTRGVGTQWRVDAFNTNSSANWVTSSAWIGLAAEIKAAATIQTYNDSVSVSRKESVLDGMTNNISPQILLSQKDGVSDGMNNSIPKSSSINEILSITDSRTVGIFPALSLLQILATTSAKSVSAQGSVGLIGDLGIGGSASSNINPNASLLNRMGVSLSGGLSLLASLSIAEGMGFSVLGNVSVYPSLTIGKRIAFVPANIALIGGSVSVGQALGLIDVPRLDAQASLALLERLGINLSSALAASTIEAALALAGHLGLSDAAQLNSFPLVGLGERLFLLDANNANMFGRNVLSEIRALSVLGGLSIQKSVAIPIDLDILTNKLISNLVNVSIQEKLGISDRVFANMQAAVSLGETTGMGNAVNQILNAGLTISVVGSVLTISGITVIIVKGFVFTSEATRSSAIAQDASKTASASDSGTTVTTTMSPNYISTDDD